MKEKNEEGKLEMLCEIKEMFKKREMSDVAVRIEFVCYFLLRLSIIDPKNRAIAGELNLCIDELADYFIGKNSWQTTSETLKRYYNAFL